MRRSTTEAECLLWVDSAGSRARKRPSTKYGVGVGFRGGNQPLGRQAANVMSVYLRSGRYFGCNRNCFFHSFSSSAATAGEGLPIKVDLPF